MENQKRAINPITLTLLIAGGLDWGLVGLFDFDLVATLFVEMSALSGVVYVLRGLSAIWQIIPLTRATGTSETRAARTVAKQRSYLLYAVMSRLSLP